MKLSTLILTLTLGLSCIQLIGQSPDNNVSQKPKENLNLDSILNIEKNTFMIDLKNGELSISGYEFIDMAGTINYKMFATKTETYTSENKVQSVKVYSSDKSYIKTYFNKHPKINRFDIVSGKIYSNKLLTKTYIKIGMTKDSVLNTLFKPSILYSKVNQLTIYEDELAEAKTMLIFKDNKLAEIRFDSSYDWIKK